MVGGCEVFEDGETGADAIGAVVRVGGEGFFLVLEDEASDELGVEFYNNWGGGRWFLCGNSEGTGEGEVE